MWAAATSAAAQNVQSLLLCRRRRYTSRRRYSGAHLHLHLHLQNACQNHSNWQDWTRDGATGAQLAIGNAIEICTLPSRQLSARAFEARYLNATKCAKPAQCDPHSMQAKFRCDFPAALSRKMHIRGDAHKRSFVRSLSLICSRSLACLLACLLALTRSVAQSFSRSVARSFVRPHSSSIGRSRRERKLHTTRITFSLVCGGAGQKNFISFCAMTPPLNYCYCCCYSQLF